MWDAKNQQQNQQKSRKQKSMTHKNESARQFQNDSHRLNSFGFYGSGPIASFSIVGHRDVKRHIVGSKHLSAPCSLQNRLSKNVSKRFTWNLVDLAPAQANGKHRHPAFIVTPAWTPSGISKLKPVTSRKPQNA